MWKLNYNMHRIIITRTDSGSSVFVEDIATGMAYQVEEDVVTEIVDLNEIVLFQNI